MPNEATIKIHRRWNLAGAIRPFTLVADDQKIGKISNLQIVSQLHSYFYLRVD